MLDPSIFGHGFLISINKTDSFANQSKESFSSGISGQDPAAAVPCADSLCAAGPESGQSAHKQIDEGKKQDEKENQNQISHKITSEIRSGNISADRGSGQGPGWSLLRKNWSAA